MEIIEEKCLEKIEQGSCSRNAADCLVLFCVTEDTKK